MKKSARDIVIFQRKREEAEERQRLIELGMDPVALEEELRKDRKGHEEPPDVEEDVAKRSERITVDIKPKKIKDDPSLHGILPAN